MILFFQIYREYLEGQKYKKKEVVMKVGIVFFFSGRGSQNQLRCEFCDVICIGVDVYVVYIRGLKY